jgi:uncharacterized protein YifE (UPF0438 family)
LLTASQRLTENAIFSETKEPFPFSKETGFAEDKMILFRKSGSVLLEDDWTEEDSAEEEEETFVEDEAFGKEYPAEAHELKNKGRIRKR